MKVIDLPDTQGRDQERGAMIRIDHAVALGRQQALEPGERVVLRWGATSARWASVVRLDLSLERTTYVVRLGGALSATAASGLPEERSDAIRSADDLLVLICEHRRLVQGCEEHCAHCALSEDSPEGQRLRQDLAT